MAFAYVAAAVVLSVIVIAHLLWGFGLEGGVVGLTADMQGPREQGGYLRWMYGPSEIEGDYMCATLVDVLFQYLLDDDVKA